jgi:hypothetical protein
VGGVVPVALAGPAGHARPAVKAHTERFTLVAVSVKGHPSVVATGVFTAGGVDHKGGSVDTLTFNNGTLTVHRNHQKHKSTLSPKTCAYAATITGKYTLSGGTGVYAGVTGHGSFKGTSSAVLRRGSNGLCTFTLKPHAYQQLVTLHGPVS